MSKQKVVLGLLAGVAIGATLGILFAPDKGTETRAKIAKKRDETLEDLEEEFHGYVKMMTDKFKLAKLRAANMAGIGTNKAAEMAERGRRRTEEIAKEAEASN